VIPIEIPPLRERSEDVPPLALACLEKHADGRPLRLTPAAMERLKRCRWEGNARELENVIERAVALRDGPEIGPEDLPLPDDEESSDAGGDSRSLLRDALERQLSLSELEDLYIDQVLESTNGNKVQAARILGINRRTLYRRGERRQAGPDEKEAGGEAAPARAPREESR
jgi:two-component system response regulator AtoC